MGFSDAVQWWEEWQLRFLVLSSLFLQYFLLVTATMRKFRAWPCVKFFTWLAYLASDAVAVYALATLFNRQRRREWVSAQRSDNASLEVLWAPILLLHLGGQDAISAYNIEDNELWSRHFLTAVSQIIVAVYIIRKTWSWDKILLETAIIFICVPGALKCMEKPFALWSASINSITSASDSGICGLIEADENLDVDDHQNHSSRREQGPGCRRQSSDGGSNKTVRPFFFYGCSGGFLGRILPNPNRKNLAAAKSQNGLKGARPSSLAEYIKAALMLFPQDDAEKPSDEGPEENKLSDFGNEENEPSYNIFEAMPYRLFVDLAYPYCVRLGNLRSMVQNKTEAHSLARCGLSRTFDRLYTKKEMFPGLYEATNILISDRNPFDKRIFAVVLRSVIINLTFAAVGFFHKSSREDYNPVDVKITYTLICCTASLEYISLYVSSEFHGTHHSRPYREVQKSGNPKLPSPQVCSDHPWPDQVAQYNLIGYLARNKKYQGLRRPLFIGKDYIDQLLCMKPCSKYSKSITELVQKHVMDGWRNCITNAVTYRDFNDKRGQRTLDLELEHEQCRRENLKLTLQRPFDESVMLWHLATDFCFHDKDEGRNKSDSNNDAHRCRVMSNYMAYLLFVKPDMLTPGARRSLFRSAYNELKEMFTDYSSSQLSAPGLVLLQDLKQLLTKKQSAGDLTSEIIKKQEEGGKDSGLVHDAWVLYQELKDLANGQDGWQKTWRVIQGVWVEMLCFSAGRCRGYLHAKSLGNGGEYLSYVWLVLWYMGMETLAERLERNEPQAQGDMGATGPTTSAPLVRTTGENSA